MVMNDEYGGTLENRALRRTFGPEMEEVVRDWRRLHNEELHGLYASPNIIRVIKSRRMGGAGRVTRMGETQNTYKVLVGKPEGKRPVERPGRRWEDNIRKDLREIRVEVVDWKHLAQDTDQWRTLVNAILNILVPLMEKFIWPAE
jgi:hypothetical protein